MPSEVRMPQLGMAQESGLIIAWLKEQGAKVAEGEPLFEVETDKATMEVEANATGYLTGLRAGAGDDVPVGDVIALIAETEDEAETLAETELPAQAKPTPEAPSATARLPETPAGRTPVAAPAAATPATPAPTPPALAVIPGAVRSASSARVLASPRARRLAAERGIELAALRRQGVGEPIHAADLDRAIAGGVSLLQARVDAAALDALLERAGEAAERNSLLAAFGAGAWRALFEPSSVTVRIRSLDGTVKLATNPDQRGKGEASGADFDLVDLCDTRLSAYVPGGGDRTLAIARDGTDIVLTFGFTEAGFPALQAIAWLDELCARIEDPIRQLL